MRGAVAAFAAALALGALLAASGLAAASGSDPVGYPSSTSALAAAAMADTPNATQSAYAESLSFHESVNLSTYSINCFHGCFYDIAFYNLSQTFPGHPGGVASGSTWVNYTGTGCLVSACGVNYTCSGFGAQGDAHPALSVYFASPCLAGLRLNWSAVLGGLGADSPKPYETFEITHRIVTERNETAGWSYVTGGTVESTRANVTFEGPAGWDAAGVVVGCSACKGNGTEAPEAFAVDAAWWFPLPAGSWSATGASVTEVDTDTAVPAANFTFTLKGLLLEWVAFPVVSANVTQHYLVSLTSLIPLGTTGPPGSTVVLLVGNETQGSSYDTASATWENYASANFTGTFWLEGSWLAGASAVSVFANGQAIPAYELSQSTSAIVVYAGYVSVPTQTTVTFVVHYEPSSLWSFTRALAVVDGLAVTPAALVVLGVAGAGAFAAYGRARGNSGDSLVQQLAGIAVLGAFVFALVALGAVG